MKIEDRLQEILSKSDISCCELCKHFKESSNIYSSDLGVCSKNVRTVFGYNYCSDFCNKYNCNNDYVINKFKYWFASVDFVYDNTLTNTCRVSPIKDNVKHVLCEYGKFDNIELLKLELAFKLTIAFICIDISSGLYVNYTNNVVKDRVNNLLKDLFQETMSDYQLKEFDKMMI